MTSDWQSIETPRLILRILPPPALAALGAGDRTEASRLTQCDLSTFAFDENFLQLRDITLALLKQLSILNSAGSTRRKRLS